MELDKIVEELRAQVTGFETQIKDLESRHATSAADKKTNSDVIASLKSEIDAIRAELAARQAPPTEKPAESWNPITWLLGE